MRSDRFRVPRYHARMNTTTRILLATALLATLSACGNKGPLVQAPRPPAPSEGAATPPATEAPTGQQTTEPATELTPPAEPETTPQEASDETEQVPADTADPPPPATDDGDP
jgi:predicted small lipoprotein YifL